MKKICGGCRAYWNDGGRATCDLGYSINSVPINVMGKDGKVHIGAIYRPVPAEECPKPTTFNKLFEAERKPKA